MSIDERTCTFVIGMIFFITVIRPYEFSMNCILKKYDLENFVIYMNLFNYSLFLTVYYDIFVPQFNEQFCEWTFSQSPRFLKKIL